MSVRLWCEEIGCKLKGKDKCNSRYEAQYIHMNFSGHRAHESNNGFVAISTIALEQKQRKDQSVRGKCNWFRCEEQKTNKSNLLLFNHLV